MFPKFTVPPGVAQEIHVVLDCGGGALGDTVCALPAINYLDNQTRGEVPFTLFVADYFLEFAKTCLPNIDIKTLTEGMQKRQLPTTHINFQAHNLKSMRRHLVHHAYTLLLDVDIKSVPDEFLNYLKPDISKVDISRFRLPEKYVVFQDGFTAQNRGYNPLELNKVFKKLQRAGYTIVILGKSSKHVAKGGNVVSETYRSFLLDRSKTYDLTNACTLLESAKICEQSKVVFGVDGGLLHLASCTDAAVVWAFTNVAPEHRLPYRNNLLGGGRTSYFKSPNCNSCQTQSWFNHMWDYRMCIYNDYKCINDLTAKLWLEHLRKYLNDI